MSVKRSLYAIDTYINSDRPNTNYGKTKRLGVKYPEQFAYATFSKPFPVGASIVKATLTWVTWGEMPETGSHTFNVTPLTTGIPYTRITHNNRPDRDLTKQVEVTRTGAQPHRQTWEVDVTDWIQDVSDGEPWYGFRIGTSDTQQRWIYSRNNTAEGVPGPQLLVEWADEPEEPTDLAPDGGTVGTPKPALTFGYVDYGGSTVLLKAQVQISETVSFASPMWDSGEIRVDGPVVKLEETSFPGATPGQRLRWRVRVMDEDNLWSSWSNIAFFDYAPLQPLTLITPDPDAPLFTDSTPDIVWSQEGIQTAWKITVFRKGQPQDLLYNTGIVAGSESQHEIPAGVLRWDDAEYEMTLRTWDERERVRAPNSLPYNYLKIAAHFTEDASSVLPENVEARKLGKTPAVEITWERAASADAWEVVRVVEGRESVIVERVDHIDALQPDGTYRYIDYGCPQNTPLWYTIRPVTNGRRSSGRRSPTYTFDGEGIWLVAPDGRMLVINGSDQGTWELPERETAHRPIGSQAPILVRELRLGYEGSIQGHLVAEEVYQPDLSAKDKYHRFMEFKTSRDTLRLVAGDQNIPVTLAAMNAYPTPHWDLRYDCTFAFWQNGEVWWEESQ